MTPEERCIRVQEMIANAVTSRMELMRRMEVGGHELYRDCKYPNTNEITADYCRDFFDREPLANRVVRMMPLECWQQTPHVFETEDPDDNTPWEDAWADVTRQLRGESSWYQDEEGSPVWEALKRVDIASGIGFFGLLFLGFDDGLPLDQPVDGVVSFTKNSRPTEEITVNKNGAPFTESASVSELYKQIGTDAQYVGVELSPSEYPSTQPAKKQRKLLYLRVFDETLVQVVQYEADLRNPRFTQPVMYRVMLTDPRDVQKGGIGLAMTTVRVHWSRVIHVADNLHCSEVFGPPRMRPVVNPLLDVQKVRGGGAEGQWRGAFPGYSLESNPQMGADVDINPDDLDEMMHEYYSGLTRTLQLVGMQAKPLSPQSNDPTAHINAATEAICIQLGCPVRVFKGSERGELASSQDDASWNDRIKERRNNYITPRIIVPFIDRLIAAGVLPIPKANQNGKRVQGTNGAQRRGGGVGDADKGTAGVIGNGTQRRGGYSVKWPDLDSNTEKDKATIALTKTQALAAYISGQCETVMPPQHWLVDFTGFCDDEQAQDMLEGAQKEQEPLTMPPPGAPGHPATGGPDPVEMAKAQGDTQVKVAQAHAKAPGFGTTSVHTPPLSNEVRLEDIDDEYNPLEDPGHHDGDVKH